MTVRFRRIHRMSPVASRIPGLAVIGGGPAGLMAAETARAEGIEVDLFDAKGSVGRKFLIAGKGGLNLTHSEPRPAFDHRYGAALPDEEMQLARRINPAFFAPSTP